MDEEIHAIEKNNTWELTDLPKSKQIIGVKWVYKTKCNAEGKVEKHKARLVVKGYKQKHGIDYEETFVPVARMETVRAILAIAAQYKLKFHQMDVKLEVQVSMHLNSIDLAFAIKYMEKYQYGGKGLGKDEQVIIKPITNEKLHKRTSRIGFG